MDNLERCKLNLESLILSTAEKYLPQLDLVMTVPGIQSFAAIGIISEIGVDMSVFGGLVLCAFFGMVLRAQCFNLAPLLFVFWLQLAMTNHPKDNA